MCESGIKFIGPRAREAMELMGDKITARRLMKENGVPDYPGYNGSAGDAGGGGGNGS